MILLCLYAAQLPTVITLPSKQSALWLQTVKWKTFCMYKYISEYFLDMQVKFFLIPLWLSRLGVHNSSISKVGHSQVG